MIPFRRILFPVDYSASCERVAPYVKDMVNHYVAGVTLLHAFGPGAFPPDALADRRAQEEEKLRGFAEMRLPSIHVDVMAEEGDPACVIHRTVQRMGCDLVMMPTFGHGPMRRFLLGSVTAKVLHDVGAAVWTSTGNALAGHAPAVPYRSILCALDDSDEAKAVLKAAAALADSYHADLHLLHAVAIPPMALEVDYAQCRTELMKAAETHIRELKSGLNIDAPHTITQNMVMDAVREEATARHADLIVLGRGQAQGAIGRMWSLLYPIVRESPCPVLSI